MSAGEPGGAESGRGGTVLRGLCRALGVGGPGGRARGAGPKGGPRHAPAVTRRVPPEPTLADHAATMRMLRESARGDPEALAEIEEWGERRERRLPVLRRFVALLARHGVIGEDTHRVTREFVVAQCFAIATRHGLDMMGYTYRDSESGPLATLLRIDLHAVEISDEPAGGLFPTPADERAFLGEIAERTHAELGRMAREAVVPERARMVLP